MECKNFMYLGLEPKIRSKLIDMGETTPEDLLEAQNQYEDYILELSKEWPPERIREIELKRLRDSYTFFARRYKEIEIQNAEERRRGVPYSKRKHYSAKLLALETLIMETTKKGKQLKATAPSPVWFYVKPGDVETVKQIGFEKLLWSYLLVHN